MSTKDQLKQGFLKHAQAILLELPRETKNRKKAN